MLRFRTDIKPPAWGPNSAVAYAVRENAHKLLGANPIVCLPLWERGFRTQIFDVFGNVVSAESTAHMWDDVGYFTGNSVSASGILVSLNNGAPNISFSVFSAVRRNGNVGFRTHISVGVNTTYRSDILMSSTAGNHFSNGNGTGYSGNTAELSSGADFTAALTLDRANSIRLMYIDSASVSASYTPSLENFNRIRFHNRVGDDNRQTNSTLKIAYAFDTVLSSDAVARLNHEPYALLMPVARPLYFDMGSVEPGTEVEGPAVITAEASIAASGSKQATSPATVTASASLGMGGVKQAVAPLNIVGSISAEASGIKSASSQATITATADFLASGIKTISGLDKEGPAIVTASATVGMGCVKGGVGAAVLGADSAVEAGGMKGAAGQAWFDAMGEFYASRGPDDLPITADEIGRSVSLQARNYSAVLAKRNYTARL